MGVTGIKRNQVTLNLLNLLQTTFWDMNALILVYAYFYAKNIFELNDWHSAGLVIE